MTLAIAGCVMMAVATVYAVTRPKPRLTSDRVPRITVLPFENFGRDDEQYVAAGLTEEITSRARRSRPPAPRVAQRAPRATIDRHAAPARSARTSALIICSMDRSPSTVRPPPGAYEIAARLIHAADDTLVWAETFDRETGDVFRVQAEIATRVVRALRGELIAGESDFDELSDSTIHASHRSDSRKTSTPGRPICAACFTPTGPISRTTRLRQPSVIFSTLSRSIRISRWRTRNCRRCRRSTTCSATTHRANGWSWRVRRSIARSRSIRGFPKRSSPPAATGSPPAISPSALAAAEAAERLRPNDAATLSATAGVLWRTGRWEDAASRLDRAWRLEPRDAMLAARLGVIRLGLREYREARHLAEQSIALERDQVIGLRQCASGPPGCGRATSRRRALLRALPATDDWRFMELRFLQALYERRYDEAVRVTRRSRARGCVTGSSCGRSCCSRRRPCGFRVMPPGPRPRSNPPARCSPPRAAASPGDGRLHGALAVALAGLGRRAEAMHHAGRALELMPHPHAFDTSNVREDAALAFTMAGAHDAALDQISILLATPAHFSVQSLRLDPGGIRSARTRATGIWSWRLRPNNFDHLLDRVIRAGRVILFVPRASPAGNENPGRADCCRVLVSAGHPLPGVGPGIRSLEGSVPL